MRKSLILLLLLAASCSNQRPMMGMQSSGMPVVATVTPVATTYTGAIAQAISISDCTLMGVAAPSLVSTSSVINPIMPLIGGILAGFFCNAAKGALAPPPQTVVVTPPAILPPGPAPVPSPAPKVGTPDDGSILQGNSDWLPQELPPTSIRAL